MTTEPHESVPAADIARITRMALKTLAEDHIIIPKEDFEGILDSHMGQSQEIIWSTVLGSYQNALAMLPEDAPKDYKKGFALGLNLIERLRDVFREENEALFAKNHDEN